MDIKGLSPKMEYFRIYWSINPIVPVEGCCRLFIKYAIPLLCMFFSVIVWCMLRCVDFRVQVMVVMWIFVIWRYLYNTVWC
jgi:hypothetical protein